MKRYLAQTRIELALTLRRGESLLVALIIPGALLAFFSIVPLLAVPGARVDSVLPGVLAIAVMATSMVSLGIATGFERSYQVLKRLGGTPLRRTELLAAKASSVLAVELGQWVVLFGIALALGWRARGNIAALAAVLGLGTLAFSGIGLFLAGTLRAEANLAVANAGFLALILLGGAIVPVDSLPGALAVIAQVLPAEALGQAVRWAIEGGGAPMGDLLLLAVWGVASGLGAVATFSWE